jgi:glycosyltransferase involved in cell wall biosynthesis
MISGFMIVKDVLKQGYPFVEAIVSALPVCDEILVSDGYSVDGTYEVLEKISHVNPKVKIYRYRWPDKKDTSVLVDVTNELRKKCHFQYIFSIQANEVLHEKSVPFIRALPSIFPNVDTFSFPYLQLLSKYKFTEEYRLRFSRNLPWVEAVWDAWTLGTTKAFVRSKALKGLIHPNELFLYLHYGVGFMYANSCYSPISRSRAIYLPEPVFRYWSLFPFNFLEKFEKHSDLFKLQGFQESSDKLRSYANSPETFWKLGYEALKQTQFKDMLNYPELFASVDKADHPAIIQEFISNPNADRYYVRKELFEIAKLK